MAKIGFHRTDFFQAADDAPLEHVKKRQCLRCHAPFISAWSGERVCRKCKTSRVWRDGIGANMASWSRH